MQRVLAFLAVFGLTTVPVFAQHDEDPETEEYIKTEVDSWFKTTDLDKDGVITVEECEKVQENWYKEVEEAGEDEETDDETWEKIGEKYAGMVEPEMLVVADADDDYKLTRKEAEAYVRAAYVEGKEIKPSAKDCEFLAERQVAEEWDDLIEIYDENGDGKLGLNELGLEGDEAAEFKAADADGDGAISRQEMVKYTAKSYLDAYGVEDGKGSTEAGDSGSDGETDAYALYKKEGRSWTIKNVTKIQGIDPMVSYMTTEVIEVGEKHATIKTTMLDGEKKPYPGMDPMEFKIEFNAAHGDGSGQDAPQMTKETITVEAGEFECWKTEMSGTTSWASVKYPGLLVKSEHANGSSELIEFTE